MPDHGGAGRCLARMLVLVAWPACAWAGDATGPRIAGIPLDFFLFVATLLGVALLHTRTLQVALAGLATITAYKLLLVPGFSIGEHFAHEWVVLANLLGLLLGFALLANQFERSGVPDLLPRILPDDWRGGFVLLVLTAAISTFLDNIAAAMIGATVAATVFERRVHPMFLAAVIAASNAGGAGSVIGDTTTTMMWIDGVPPLHVAEAGLGAAVGVTVSGIIASIRQDRHHRIRRDPDAAAHLDGARLAVVGAMLAATITANIASNVLYPGLADRVPVLGLALWAAIAATAPYRPPEWSLLPDALRGAAFLLALVTCASMMPVSELPAASWPTALGLGFVSAVFDNIPLTALALRQGGYDWGFLAWAVGFGGSMLWFGSSAGVAVANRFPELKSTPLYLRNAWPVLIAYVLGFFVMLAVLGWRADAPHRDDEAPPPGDLGRSADPLP